jgi:predicted nucleotide-binding protein
VGRAINQKDEQPRARQNVILELGYFMGRLGRNRTCALYKKGGGLPLEFPSDFLGIVYVPMDEGDGWRIALGKDLRKAGFDFDFNKVLE